MRPYSQNTILDLLFLVGISNGIGSVAITFLSVIMAIVDFHTWSFSAIYADYYKYFTLYFPYSFIIAGVSTIVLLILYFFSLKKQK